MAWTNVFDIGDCEIVAYRDGVLIAPADYAAEGITSLVESSGVVTLVTDAAGSSAGLSIDVVPSFDPAAAPVRVSSVSMDGSGYGPILATLDGGETESVALSVGDPTYTPDPAVFASYAAGWASAGVQMEGLA